MMVLVDTSIWSLALRRSTHQLSPAHAQQRRKLEEIVTEGRVRLLGPIRQELLSGIRSREQFLGVREKLRHFPDVVLEREDYESAAELNNKCRTVGITGSPIDFLLCAAAIRWNWAIYTNDQDFEHYRKHLPLALY